MGPDVQTLQRGDHPDHNAPCVVLFRHVVLSPLPSIPRPVEDEANLSMQQSACAFELYARGERRIIRNRGFHGLGRASLPLQQG